MSSSIYDRMGVRQVIVGKGWYTNFGGSIMHPEVVQAMFDAVPHFVDMLDLHRAAGEAIAQATGAEAGLVTAGASAALVLAAAACMTGPDPAKAAQLPDTTGLKNEIVMPKSQRNRYDVAFRMAGARVVDAGDAQATRVEELEAAINERTAAVAFVKSLYMADAMPYEQLIQTAHRKGMPVIVDAAPSLPPAMNLTRFIAAGADLVVFSGGKGIGGPQSSGILCGRKDLVQGAVLQMLSYNAPNEGIGRPMKVCKEEIIGLLTALDRFVRTDHKAQRQAWTALSQAIVRELQGIPGVRACLEDDDAEHPAPVAVAYLEPYWKGRPALEIQAALQRGTPAIELGCGGYKQGLWVVPFSLRPGDEAIVARRLREELTAS